MPLGFVSGAISLIQMINPDVFDVATTGLRRSLDLLRKIKTINGSANGVGVLMQLEKRDVGDVVGVLAIRQVRGVLSSRTIRIIAKIINLTIKTVIIVIPVNQVLATPAMQEKRK